MPVSTVHRRLKRAIANPPAGPLRGPLAFSAAVERLPASKQGADRAVWKRLQALVRPRDCSTWWGDSQGRAEWKGKFALAA